MNSIKDPCRSLRFLTAAMMLAAITTTAGSQPPNQTDSNGRQEDTAVQASDISADDERRAVAAKGLGDSRVMTVPAAAFGYDGTDADGYRFSHAGGFIRGEGVGDYCGMAPVYLPHGAVIGSFWATIYDHESDDDINITLSRVDTHGFHESDEMAVLNSSGSATTIQKLSTVGISFPTVDSPRYAYYLTTCLADFETRLYSVRIWFVDPEVFSDGFELGNSDNWSQTIGGSKALESGDDCRGDRNKKIHLPLVDMAQPELRDKLREQTKAYGSPLVVPAADFMHEGVVPGYLTDSTAGYIQPVGLGYSYNQAPVYLPEGANVESVWAVVRDNDDSCLFPNVLVWMQRADNSTGATDEMAFLTSTGEDTNIGWISNTEPEFTEIQYPEYQYYLAASLCDVEHRLYAVVIYYSR